MSKQQHSAITPGHVRAYQAVISGMYDNITLWSCRINGEPGVAIVMVDQPTQSTLAVMPLFVAITPGMDIQFDGDSSGSGGGGGPQNPKESFESNKHAVTTPNPR